ncbi:unnamed protein product [Moneuplotes crassus]|uniref:ZZ-type domain-containing protein n=1 Tax=Euplotes crassus TaxID=5936 RepID=A0AAD2D0X9_EUPCR|nr:unnamed protein product [Moneuplotes crassus]
MSAFEETSFKISVDGEVYLMQEIKSYDDLKLKIFEQLQMKDNQYHLIDPMSVTPIFKNNSGLEGVIKNSLMKPPKLILQKVERISKNDQDHLDLLFSNAKTQEGEVIEPEGSDTNQSQKLSPVEKNTTVEPRTAEPVEETKEPINSSLEKSNDQKADSQQASVSRDELDLDKSEIQEEAKKTQEELYEHIQSLLPKGMEQVIKLVTDKTSKFKAKSQLQRDINLFKGVFHKNVKCTSCKQKPIIGIRYKCPICNKYDVCAKCEAEDSHEHGLLKIRTPKDFAQFLNLIPK